MCHFTLQLNTCGHLSSTYKNIRRCHQLLTKCRFDPAASNPQLHLTLQQTPNMSLHSDDSDDESNFKPAPPQPLSSLLVHHECNNSSIRLEMNSRTKCFRCAPVEYAREMEREEGRDHKRCAREDAEAWARTAETVSDVLAELDEMIREGYEEGWGDEARLRVKVEGKKKMRKKKKEKKEKKVGFLLPGGGD